jgi:hypothetical protein
MAMTSFDEWKNLTEMENASFLDRKFFKGGLKGAERAAGAVQNISGLSNTAESAVQLVMQSLENASEAELNKILNLVMTKLREVKSGRSKYSPGSHLPQ